MNQAREKRLHRSKKIPDNNQLGFIHQSMLRMLAIREILFSKQLNGQYIRRYVDISHELTAFAGLTPIEHITAILLCAKEAEHIGNLTRFELAKADLLKHLPLLKGDKPCQGIQSELSTHILEYIEGLVVPQYSIKFIHGFSLPASWRSIYDEHALKQIEKEFISKYLDTEE